MKLIFLMSNTTKRICCEMCYFLVTDFMYFSHCLKGVPISFLNMQSPAFAMNTA